MEQDRIGGWLDAGVHRLPVRVYYEDTDAGGVIYHASHVRFFERGRTEFLRALGVGQRAARAEDGVLFMVRRMALDFLRPGLLDDQLVITTRVEALGASVIELVQSVERGAETLAKARVTCATVGAAGRPVRLPPAIRERFAETVT